MADSDESKSTRHTSYVIRHTIIAWHRLSSGGDGQFSCECGWSGEISEWNAHKTTPIIFLPPEMVDRVAKRLYQHACQLNDATQTWEPWESANPNNRRYWAGAAALAIQEMREPTKKMMVFGNLQTGSDKAGAIWQWMIEAAMRE